MENAFQALQLSHTSTIALLDVRTSELCAAEKFLARVDSYSDADITRLVQELNGHIFQVAAQIADYVPTLTAGEAGRDLDEAKMEAMAKLLGPNMLDILLSRQHGNNMICIEIAVQACISTHLTWLIRLWSLNRDVESVLFEMVRIMQRSNQSLVAGGLYPDPIYEPSLRVSP